MAMAREIQSPLFLRRTFNHQRYGTNQKHAKVPTAPIGQKFIELEEHLKCFLAIGETTNGHGSRLFICYGLRNRFLRLFPHSSASSERRNKCIGLKIEPLCV